MKHKGWYYPLAGLVVIVLAAGSFFLSGLLPDHKNVAQAHEEVPRVVQQINASEEILMYPWNQYEAGSVQTVPNALETDNGENLAQAVWAYMECMPEVFQMESWSRFSQNSTFEYDVSSNIYYLSEYVYKNRYGDQCKITAALLGDFVIDLRCSYVEKAQYKQEQIDEMTKKISQWINFDNYTHEEMYKEAEQNPIVRFVLDCWYQHEGFAQQEIDDKTSGFDMANPIGYVHPFEISSTGATVIYYEDYFILPFYDNGTGNTIYLYFDPKLEAIVGFNLNWRSDF